MMIEPSSGDVTLEVAKQPENIVFQLDSDHWLFELSKDGIKFNHEAFPQYGPEEFATKFIDVLEETFEIQFNPKAS